MTKCGLNNIFSECGGEYSERCHNQSRGRGLLCLGISGLSREDEEKRKKALNTVFDCDTAAALTPRPPDKFAKCVSIKHDLTARQLSLQDCIISAAGVDPVCQPLSVLRADRGRGDVKACLYRQIITPRKHAICRVRGQNFHKQTPPGCQGVDLSHLRLRADESLFAFCRWSCCFLPGDRSRWRARCFGAAAGSTSSHFSPGANLCLSQRPRRLTDRTDFIHKYLNPLG